MLLSLLFIALFGATYTTQPNIAKLGNPTPNVFRDKKQVVWDNEIRDTNYQQLNTNTYTGYTYDANTWYCTLYTKNQLTLSNDNFTLQQINVTKYQFNLYYEEQYPDNSFDYNSYTSYTITKLKSFNNYAFFTYYQNILKQNQTILDTNGYKYNFETQKFTYGNEWIYPAQVNTTTNQEYQKYWNASAQEIYEQDYQIMDDIPDNSLTNYYGEYTGFERRYNPNSFEIEETLTNDEPPIWSEIIFVECRTRHNNNMDYSDKLQIYTNDANVMSTEDLSDGYYQTLFDINQNPIAPTFNVKTYNTSSYEIDIHYDNPGAQSGEVIDLAGLMWEIIGMPFTFINQAFNVTLFPGTIYEINIGTLVKGLIAILTLLFIIKVFTGGLNTLGQYTGSISDTRTSIDRTRTKIQNNKKDRELYKQSREGVKEPDK